MNITETISYDAVTIKNDAAISANRCLDNFKRLMDCSNNAQYEYERIQYVERADLEYSLVKMYLSYC